MNWCKITLLTFGASVSALNFHRVAWLNSLFSSRHVCGVEIAELKEAVSATEPRIAAITENYLKYYYQITDASPQFLD